MNALVDAARQYLGVPFAHIGRADHALDCAGLVKRALNDTGRYPVDVAAYPRTPVGNALREAVEAFFGPPARMPLQVGDVVLIAKRPGGPANHMAIVSDYPGGLGLIHTRADIHRGQQKGRVTEHRLDEKWASRIVGVYR